MHVKNYILFLLTIILFFNCEGESPSEMQGDNVSSPNLSEEIEKSNFTKPSTGHFMIKSPKQMEVNQSDNIEVWITKDSIRDAAFFKENLSQNDSIVIEQIRVGEVMEVNLIEENEADHNFNITALSTPQQIVDDFDAVRWKWIVRPLKEGVHQLIVIARIKMMTEDLKLIGYKDLPVINRTINVKVAGAPVGEQKSNNYWFLLALIPIIGILVWFLIRKKKTTRQQYIDPNEFNGFEVEIQDLIKKDRIKRAFDVFDAFIQKHPNETLENAVVLLKSNYSNNESRFNKNLIDNDEYNLNRSKIINELLEMIDLLQPN